MSNIIYRDYFDVELVDWAGSDGRICQAARVSTLGAESLDTSESFGLINFLMKNRHGSPFEHGMMTYRISAPIFVWREFMRHRIGFSYNEQSGRYMELAPIFYIPATHFYNKDEGHFVAGRPLVQEGKPGEYRFTAGSTEMSEELDREFRLQYLSAWNSYKIMLADGVAKEVARMVLPVGIYSTAYVTCNPRSMMSFLSLRTRNDISMFPSYPQWEIEQVARLMEEEFAERYPLTHRAFMEHGRVSP